MSNFSGDSPTDSRSNKTDTSDSVGSNNTAGLLRTPTFKPVTFPQPETPSRCSTADDSEVSVVSLNSPPLTPPRRIIKRLTPIGQYSPKKRSDSIDEDLATHERRRLQLLSDKISKASSHSSIIIDKLNSSRKSREMKKLQLERKYIRAVKNKNEYIEQKRNIASATIKSIVSSHSSLSYISTSTESQLLSALSEGQSSHHEQTKTSGKSFECEISSSLTPLQNMQKMEIFNDLSETIKTMDVKTVYKFIHSERITDCFAELFRELNPDFVDPSVAARCFLYGLALLVERDKFDRFKKKTSYMFQIGKYPPAFFRKHFSDLPTLRRYHMNDNYYEFVVKMICNSAYEVWDILQRYVSNGGSKSEKVLFVDIFESEFYPRFQVFKYNHWFRSLILLISGSSSLNFHLSFLKSIQSITSENDPLAKEYKDMVERNELYIESNKTHFDRMKKSANGFNMKLIEKQETLLYLAHKSNVLSGSLTDDNPLISVGSTRASSEVSKLSRSEIKKYHALVPPSFSIENWRKVLFMVVIEYRKHQQQNPTTVPLVLRSGKRPRFLSTIGGSSNSPKMGKMEGFSSYIETIYQADIEQIRAWLGLKTYDEGCIEAIERLSYLDTVDEMMVDIVQMVERCLYAMYIVMQDEQDKVNLVFPDSRADRADHTQVISLLSDSVFVLCQLQKGELSIKKYFKLTLELLRTEIPDYLKPEAEQLLLKIDTIDKYFAQKFVELIKDCMIFGVNGCITSCLKAIGANVIEIERDLFNGGDTSCDIPLNLRHPNLFRAMMAQKAIIPTRLDSPVLQYEYFNKLFINFVCSANGMKRFEMPEHLENFSIQVMEISNAVKATITLQSLSVILVSYLKGEDVKIHQGVENTSFQGKKCHQLIDFRKLLVELDGFLMNYFDNGSTAKLGIFFKHEVFKILINNAKSKLLDCGLSVADTSSIIEWNFDSKYINGLIDQIEKVNIGSSNINSLRTIYSTAVSDIILANMLNRGIIPNINSDLDGYTFSPVSTSDFDSEKVLNLKKSLKVSYDKFYKSDLIISKLQQLVEDYYNVFNLCFEIYIDNLVPDMKEFGMMVTILGGGVELS
ncbi:hypothetical protein CANARDRAFT_21384 [[Candida] arabinofermentans NRRL YB-2248]|uniref:Uncharacterized protein n=1 Tax=[Candida] arabinofermentans NRRL YB-2248 TaxID=983967 RepID=A0A1E4T6S0_9ASCO|nr:hypothetical protein CANARDRAFT_21384 [[Candida] arabinofermentans NRRL YB-2248]